MNRRRKECLDCGRRMTTYEYIEEIELMVRKKDGRLERFNLACEKRPVSLEDMRDLAEKVRQSILEEGREVVSSQEIGDLVMGFLKELDYVSYVRFASVYRNFTDPEDFDKLLSESRQA